jgi:3-oxoacyl-[acyl-carrier-protein] synthase-1
MDFPSPALFVYTLPNIVTGEIAIRNKYAGETSAFVMEKFDPELFVRTVEEAFQDRETREAVVGWIDCRSEEDFEAFAFLVGRENGQYEFNKDNVIWKI